MMKHYLYDGPADAAVTLILAHGAGAAMDSPWMNDLTALLAAAGLRVVRFEFPYMRRRREEGSRRPPDRAPKLLAAWNEVIDDHATADSTLLIGGKSMGGRMASMIADDRPEVGGVVCLGYPFHPPGKPDKLRVDHLKAMRTRTLIVQGERDPFGGPDEVAGYDLPDSITVEWMADGDHGFKPRKASGHSLEGHLAACSRKIAVFSASLGSD